MAFSGFIFAVLLLSLASHARPCSDQEKSSLLRFMAGLSRDSGLAVSWRNATAGCCSWEGITCDDGDDVVVEVSLPGRGLQGLLSPALGDLTGLRCLNLSHNLLSGELPLEQLLYSSRGMLTIDVSFNRLEGELLELPSSANHGWPLQVLNISSNLFTGEFSSGMWKAMNSLVAVNASNNSFIGVMPSSFCISSPSLAVLDFSYNKFSGSIPAGLGNCSALKVLKAGHNNLSGALTDELFDASSLEYLSFSHNGLHGILDGAHIINLRNLAHLDLGGNQLNGKIPDTIGELKRLEELHLDHNDMYGELPSSLSNCTNLVIIDFRNNYFSGELTKVNFSTLINLKTLDLLFNSFTGIIPESIYSCRNLKALRLADNKLHGQLSPRIVNLKTLVFLSVSFNNFTNITNALHILKDCKELAVLIIGSNFKGEAMPEDETIDGFQNLQFLSLARCSLSGKIPLWLSKLKNLEMLLLHNNQLTGPIPAWINSLNLLFHIDVSENNLTGC